MKNSPGLFTHSGLTVKVLIPHIVFASVVLLLFSICFQVEFCFDLVLPYLGFLVFVCPQLRSLIWN